MIIIEAIIYFLVHATCQHMLKTFDSIFLFVCYSICPIVVVVSISIIIYNFVGRLLYYFILVIIYYFCYYVLFLVFVLLLFGLIWTIFSCNRGSIETSLSNSVIEIKFVYNLYSITLQFPYITLMRLLVIESRAMHRPNSYS